MRRQRLNKVFLYDEGTPQILKIEELAAYLREKLTRAGVKVRGNPFHPAPDKNDYFASKIAAIKLQDVTKRRRSEQKPFPAEIEYEKRRILGQTKAFGVFYDGWELHRILGELIPREEQRLDFVHIFLTNRLFATWEDRDRRYHARTSLYGFPSIVSTSGVVEAPAKPREYYLLKQQYEMLGKDSLELKDKFMGRFIDFEDERLTEVIKGYVTQAVFYSLIGDPFCNDRGCRLYNAHWQEELIFAQLESEYEFCPRHKTLIEAENDC